MQLCEIIHRSDLFKSVQIESNELDFEPKIPTMPLVLTQFNKWGGKLKNVYNFAAETIIEYKSLTLWRSKYSLPQKQYNYAN